MDVEKNRGLKFDGYVYHQKRKIVKQKKIVWSCNNDRKGCLGRAKSNYDKTDKKLINPHNAPCMPRPEGEVRDRFRKAFLTAVRHEVKQSGNRSNYNIYLDLAKRDPDGALAAPYASQKRSAFRHKKAARTATDN